MKKIWLITPMIIVLAAFSVFAQMGDHSSHSMEAETKTDMVRCAYDGMMMKASAMVSMKHGDETMYFCNKEQMEAFHKSPKKYLRKMNVGGLHVLMNVLTMKEYMDMMKNMGMGMMAKMGDPNDTHWVNVYLASEQPVELSGIAVKLVAPGGKTSFKDLKYDKMMKGYTGKLSFLESGKYKLHALVGMPGIEMP